MTITIGEKTYEADTPAEANKIIRKHAKEAAKKQHEDSRKREEAHIRAKARACELYHKILSGAQCPPGWIAYQLSHPYAKGLCERIVKDWTYRMDVDGKQIEIELWRQPITYAVCNGSGVCWCFFTSEMGTIRAYTIAQYEGVHAVFELASVSVSFFNKPKSER